MSRHYFPSVLDDFEKQSSEQSTIPTSNNAEAVATTVQQLDPKYYNWFLLLSSYHFTYKS